MDLLKDSNEPAMPHTDQGSAFTAMAYDDLIKDTDTIRSMSRAGKPTDKLVDEALNSWIKEELYAEFHLGQRYHREDFKHRNRF